MIFEVCPLCKRKSHTKKQLDKCFETLQKSLNKED